MTHEDADFTIITERLRLILPAPYQDRADEVQPVSMGSAGLKYGLDGQVAWDQIWGSFCDLALAGGPPHRGTLLAPGDPEAIAAAPGTYAAVQAEICRGITLVTGLYAEPVAECGWVRMYATSAAMAGCLARAIVTENVSARFVGLSLFLPAGPAYRVEKEIKNVITAVAKTCHYWLEHTLPEQQEAIAKLFRELDAESPLIVPGDESEGLRDPLVQRLFASTGLEAVASSADGWLGLRCPDVRMAVWTMRVLVVLNVLSRREQDIVFVPLNAVLDPDGEIVQRALVLAHHYVGAAVLPQ